MKANELSKRYNINSFPQFYFFSGGKMRFQYHGARSAEKFIEFCKDPQFIEPPKTEGGFEVESNVTILASNADDWIKTTKSCMVMVHTAWCGHCKRMKPDYILAADDLKKPIQHHSLNIPYKRNTIKNKFFGAGSTTLDMTSFLFVKSGQRKKNLKRDWLQSKGIVLSHGWSRTESRDFPRFCISKVANFGIDTKGHESAKPWSTLC